MLNDKLRKFLDGNKSNCILYIPILHTNKYELSQNSGASDLRFKRVHTIMPQFISEEFMEDKDNGTDELFDFHQLVDHDYSKSGSHLRYGTAGGNSFSLQNQYANTHSESDIDGMYAYAHDVLDDNTHISSVRHNSSVIGTSNDLIPQGQSLWQQVFNPNGRGVGLFVQLNWSCGNAGSARCAEDGGNYEVSS